MRSAIPFTLLIISSFWNHNPLLGQARLILNGAKINITNGATLVINNSSADAITRYDGHIISEGENNLVKWTIGTTADNYILPCGFGTSGYMPLSFTTSSASGSGEFVFSTYRTGWLNSASMPTGVTNVAGNNIDNSPYLLDRFWQINAQGYTLKPTLSNLSFGYLDIEHTIPNNTIAEDFLSAQRWNDNSNTWNDLAPIGVSDVTNNVVTIPALNPSNLFKWWVLVDNAYPLPLSFLSFSIQNINKKANLRWTTTDEVNVRDFDVERSYNGIDFDSIGSVFSNNNGNTINYYKFIDPSVLDGTLYYRIKQNDINGIFKYSKIKTITINNPALIELYPNPVVNGKIVLNTLNVPLGNYTFSLYDLQSKLVFSKTIHFEKNLIEINLNNQLQNNNYMAVISNANFFFCKKIIILQK